MKIIIENKTNRLMQDIMPHVMRVISNGRVSNNKTQYCHITTWDSGISVIAIKNKKSDRFIVK